MLSFGFIQWINAAVQMLSNSKPSYLDCVLLMAVIKREESFKKKKRKKEIES